MNAVVEYKNISPEELWKTLISEVIFYSEFKLSGVLKEKADRELANMKRNIMNIANTGGTKIDALPIVHKYNKSITDIVSKKVETLHLEDLDKGYGSVYIPEALSRKANSYQYRNYWGILIYRLPRYTCTLLVVLLMVQLHHWITYRTPFSSLRPLLCILANGDSDLTENICPSSLTGCRQCHG